MAEFLVKATKNPWDDLKQSEVNALDDVILPGQKYRKMHDYKARSQMGDIIAVRPDGWSWGTQETLPNFIVIKVPSMPIEEAMQYEQPLYETFINEDGLEEKRVLRKRKHSFPKLEVLAHKLANNHQVTHGKNQFLNKLKIKNGAADEIDPPVADNA